jgi:hypothetical protein
MQNLASYIDQIDLSLHLVTNKTCTAQLDIRSNSTHIVEYGTNNLMLRFNMAKKVRK